LEGGEKPRAVPSSYRARANMCVGEIARLSVSYVQIRRHRGASYIRDRLYPQDVLLPLIE
jgi:hypothetical protein